MTAPTAESLIADRDAVIAAFAARVARDAPDIDDAERASLRARGLSDADIVDVILAVAARCFFSTVLDATGTRADAAYRERLPADLVGALTGLTSGRFPVAAHAIYAESPSAKDAKGKRAVNGNAANVVESKAGRTAIDIFAKPGSPVIAVQDGEIRAIGESAKLGRYVVLQDVYGNRYTYSHLGQVAAPAFAIAPLSQSGLPTTKWPFVRAVTLSQMPTWSFV